MIKQLINITTSKLINLIYEIKLKPKESNGLVPCIFILIQTKLMFILISSI